MRTGNVGTSTSKTLAGRHWFRAYANGCGFRLVDVPIAANLQGVEFLSAAEWLYRTSGVLLIGACCSSLPCALVSLVL